MSVLTGGIIRQGLDGQNYRKVKISDGGGRGSGKRGNGQRSRSVARLVALHHVPNPDSKPEVNHRNWNRTDNRAVNLEWVTKAENIRHRWWASRLWARALRKMYDYVAA